MENDSFNRHNNKELKVSKAEIRVLENELSYDRAAADQCPAFEMKWIGDKNNAIRFFAERSEGNKKRRQTSERTLAYLNALRCDQTAIATETAKWVMTPAPVHGEIVRQIEDEKDDTVLNK